MKRLTWIRVLCIACASCLLPSVVTAQSTDFREALRLAEPTLATVTVSAKASIKDESPEEEAKEDEKAGPRIEILRDDPAARLRGRFLAASNAQPVTSSAFAVGPSTLIAHIRRPVDEVEVELIDGSRIDGTVRVFDYVTGLAVIEVEDQQLESLIVSAASAQPGLPIVATWLKEGRLVSDAGMIASRPIANRDGYGLSPEVDFGGTEPPSGAPLLDGNGMIVGTMIPIGNRVYCVPAEAIQRLVDEAGNADGRTDVKRGLVGIQFEGGGPLVLEVQPDSGASEAGVKEGDL
ncbi:MAG: hypothetical protein AAGJ83_07395, partial [Planctomycetota bacterium]